MPEVSRGQWFSAGRPAPAGGTALPRVDIIMAHENMDGALIDAAVAAGAKGVVCVRASRVATGRVGRNVEVDDDKLGLVASLGMNPQKARVLLRLALTKTTDVKQIQKYFDEY
jgi:L-asparaginase